MRNVISTVGTIVGAGLLGVLAGCASSSPRWGRVVEPAVGTPFADFTYVDADGQPQTLAEHLGDFTILAFTKCGGELHGPVSQKLAELVKAGQVPGEVRTIGYDIHWSESGCAHDAKCHLLGAERDLYSVCDAKGAVRKLYGVNGESQVFVIGPDRRIVMQDSTATNLDAIRSRFAGIIRDYADKKSNQDYVAKRYNERPTHSHE